jgi:hypothetical protein
MHARDGKYRSSKLNCPRKNNQTGKEKTGKFDVHLLIDVIAENHLTDLLVPVETRLVGRILNKMDVCSELQER